MKLTGPAVYSVKRHCTLTDLFLNKQPNNLTLQLKIGYAALISDYF